MQNFEGFGFETIKFLVDLNRNNNKEWFADNRKRYEQFYLVPAMNYVNAMEEVVQKLSPPHQASAKINGSVRRINRDVRFSKDKSPYQPRIHLVFWTGTHPNRSSAIHLVIHPNGIGYGAGQWVFEPGQIDQMRQAISRSAPRKSLEAALAMAEAAGCTMAAPELKNVPAGFEKDVEWADLYKRKSLVARTMDNVATPKALSNGDAVAWSAELFEKLAPLNHWINTHIGN